MNTDQFEGRWKEAKGSLKQKWGQLTDDDLAVIDGKKDVLAGKLQAYYGMTKENAEAAIDKWSSQTDTEGNIWDTLQGSWASVAGSVKKQFGKLTDNDILESQGRRDELAGKIQREYGVSLGDAYEMVDDWAATKPIASPSQRSML